MNNTVHDHYTRPEKHFHVPLYKSLQKSKCLRCSGVKINNYMAEHMNYNCSYVSFKYFLTKAFIKKWYDPVARGIVILFSTMAVLHL